MVVTQFISTVNANNFGIVKGTIFKAELAIFCFFLNIQGIGAVCRHTRQSLTFPVAAVLNRVLRVRSHSFGESTESDFSYCLLIHCSTRNKMLTCLGCEELSSVLMLRCLHVLDLKPQQSKQQFQC